MDKSAYVKHSISKDPASILWMLFLSCLLIPAAIIINFDIGDSRFESQLADYIANNQDTLAQP